jgi:hypothetical protein
MQVGVEICLTEKSIREMKIWLVMYGLYLLMNIPFLITLINALSTAPSNNRVFGTIVTCLVATLVVLAGWNLFLLMINVKRANFLDAHVVLDRLLAPTIKVPYSCRRTEFNFATPSWNVPYYQKGVVCSCCGSIFYVSNNLAGADTLIDRLSREPATGV